MKIQFYGTRGSIPVCEKNFSEFGGNTTCVLVREGNDVLIFDAGTGIRKLGKDLMVEGGVSKGKTTIAFSHFHWDHIQGFPFFSMAYNQSNKFDLAACHTELTIPKLVEIFERLMSSTYFPVQLENMGADFSFNLKKTINDVITGYKLTASPHAHPGGANGFRLEGEGKVLTFCTDVEHGDGIDMNVVKLAENADVLIHDAQYTAEELAKCKGWGHSSWEQAIEVAELANVKRLYLTHHDPEHDDDFLRTMEVECQERFSSCFLAREGMEVVI